MASFIHERQAEIDDPVAVALRTMVERYQHLDKGAVSRALVPIAEAVEAARRASETGDEAGTSHKDDLSTVLLKASELLGTEYAIACFLTLVQAKAESNRDRGNSDDLRASLFAGLIADFELFMVSLLTHLYSDDPRTLSSKERTFTWSEVMAISDLADFREEMVEQAVVDVMRGSLADWMTALKRDHDVEVDVYTGTAQMAEFFQRRHVIVHNGGKASRLYIKKCPKVAVELGEDLPVSLEYFRDAADALAVAALGLAVAAMLKVPSESPTWAEKRMADWTYELLLRRRYQAVDLYLSALPVKRLQDLQIAEICRVNHWIALKRLGRFGECRASVEGWQVDHLGDRFKLAKLALLDDVPEAARLCKQMRDRDELPLRHWIEWPILEEVRAYEAAQAETPADVTGDLGPDDGLTKG